MGVMVNKVILGIRHLCFYLLITPITIVIATLGWLSAPLPRNWRYRVITSWSHIFIHTARLCLGLNFQVSGLQNLPKPPYVVLCNHQSTWETIFMQVLLPPQSWVLKKQLLFIPFFGWGLALLEPIAVSRTKITDIKLILAQGRDKLASGRCVIFYPEGTRLAPGQTKKFSRTGAALAAQAKVPVVPIAHNAGKFWPRGLWVKNPGTIQLKIGKPIESTDVSAITRLAEDWIVAHKDCL